MCSPFSPHSLSLYVTPFTSSSVSIHSVRWCCWFCLYVSAHMRFFICGGFTVRACALHEPRYLVLSSICLMVHLLCNVKSFWMIKLTLLTTDNDVIRQGTNTTSRLHLTIAAAQLIHVYTLQISHFCICSRCDLNSSQCVVFLSTALKATVYCTLLRQSCSPERWWSWDVPFTGITMFRCLQVDW